MIEGRYEIYGSTKSSYSRDTTYTLLPAEGAVENKSVEELEEDSSGEEPSAESPDTVMEGPDKSAHHQQLPEDDEFEDPGYEKIMLAQENDLKTEEQEEEESTYEIVPKVAQQVSILKQAVIEKETVKEKEKEYQPLIIENREDSETLCDSLEKVEEPIVIEAKPIDLSHYDTLAPRTRKEPKEVKEDPVTRPSVIETVKAINNRNMRAAQSLELLSNRLFTKRGEEANNNIITCEMVKANSVDRVNRAIKEHAKMKEKRVTYHSSVDQLSRKAFFRSADSAVDQPFLEEEYSYEPELKTSSTKLVMRTRSLVNLEEEQGFRGQTRGKITTGPDGTFRIGGRKANSELNLSDESDQGSEGESKKPVHMVSGEELRKRKQEIFKARPAKLVDNDKFFREINGGEAKTTKEQAIDNLKRYLRENKIGLRDLLINNNIVIIEPYREENDRDISEYSTRCLKEEKCRITGATIKTHNENSKPESNTLPRASKPYQPTVQRHFFYRCFKTNQKYVDDDLPDPDKVRYARELFQRVGKYAAPEDTILMLPIAAKMYKRDPGPRTTPEVRVVDVPIHKKTQQEQNRRWTDTGSQSSGVSSDMSEETREGFSEEEHENEVRREIAAATFSEAQPVSPEVLKKIRACGTSVTYYGGRMIARSEGPARSPMTMTILDEIRTGHQRRPSQDYLGVKFRLIKSNSCGSRLELAGTHTKTVRRDIFGGKSLDEELAEVKRPVNMEKKGDAKSAHGSWRQLIETRKQARTRAHTSTPRYSDIEFEEFQVAES